MLRRKLFSLNLLFVCVTNKKYKLKTNNILFKHAFHKSLEQKNFTNSSENEKYKLMENCRNTYAGQGSTTF